jgi:hypothetical protein
LFAHARASHGAGRFQQAEALYRETLAVDPDHADSWHLLGVLPARLAETKPPRG